MPPVALPDANETRPLPAALALGKRVEVRLLGWPAVTYVAGCQQDTAASRRHPAARATVVLQHLLLGWPPPVCRSSLAAVRVYLIIADSKPFRQRHNLSRQAVLRRAAADEEVDLPLGAVKAICPALAALASALSTRMDAAVVEAANDERHDHEGDGGPYVVAVLKRAGVFDGVFVGKWQEDEGSRDCQRLGMSKKQLQKAIMARKLAG